MGVKRFTPIFVLFIGCLIRDMFYAITYTDNIFYFEK